jgi:hypothetical protein
MGVVVEVSMSEGLDILAAYADHSARYFNYSSAAIIWEHPDTSLDGPIDQLFEAANRILAQVGVWERPRPPAPANPGKDQHPHASRALLRPGTDANTIDGLTGWTRDGCSDSPDESADRVS